MRKRRFIVPLAIGAVVIIFVLAAAFAVYYFTICACGDAPKGPFASVRTFPGTSGTLKEPFGVAVKGGEIYVSDGAAGKIWKMAGDAPPVVFASGLATPSAIAFDPAGDLIVAESGSSTIKRIDPSGKVTLVAGVEGQFGDADGDASSALFNAPIGVAVKSDGAIIIADTYNDKIKMIAGGKVTTLAGSVRGFADGIGMGAKFDTPCSVAVWKDGRIVVADTLNSRIRVIEPDGTTWTLAGTGNAEITDGSLADAAFYRPMSVAVNSGEIFIGDNNAVRAIRGRTFPLVETISRRRRGFIDGAPHFSAFNRVSGIAFTSSGDLIVADSDNSAVRVIAAQPLAKTAELRDNKMTRTDPAEFRSRQSARWPYDPPEAKRDIAGTLGELRGEIVDKNSEVHFHNGLDIAGNYGERAVFIRDEVVLNPVSTENFNTLREMIRLPEIGYIHIRLGRDATNRTLGDSRFLFDANMSGVRVRRGTRFNAGDIIGTLNAMNHVHLIAGPSGDEMNALDALILPGVIDTTPPVIESVELLDENWRPVETVPSAKRIMLTGNTRIVVRAFDRVDGNPDRRRLGVFRLGYQVLRKDGSPLTDVNWNISFDRNPDADAVMTAYAPGSKSGATGETIFKYVVTNKVDGDVFSEGFLDPKTLGPGEYAVRAFAADFFGNTVSKDITFEVTK